MKLKTAISLLLLLLSVAAFSQFGDLPLNNDYSRFLVKGDADDQYNFHTSVKPYKVLELDSFKSRMIDLNIPFNSTVLNEMINGDTASPVERFLRLALSPVVYSMYSQGTSNDTTDYAHNLGIGVDFKGFVGKDFVFQFEYTYSSNKYADYVEEYISDRGVIPGMGKAVQNGDRWVNHFYSGYAAYQPVEYFNVQAGVGKHFIGNGYRSLLLSDNSYVYPYLKLTFDIWKFKYQVLYSNYKNVKNRPNEDLYDAGDKYSTSNLLSMNFGKNWNVSLFQSVVWNSDPETGRGFDVNYLNPFIFFRPVEFSVGSPDNMILGMDVKYHFLKKHTIYAQLVLDEFLLNEFRDNKGWWGNKYGYQIGYKTFDIFNVKGLSLLAEHNWVRPFTYSHGNSLQNYANYNEALAHTLGANFYEFVGQATYTKKRWVFSYHTVHAVKGEDFTRPETNYGGNIFLSNQSRTQDYDNQTGQGWSSRRQYHQIKIGYLISPDSRWMVELGFTHRSNYMEESVYSGSQSSVNNMVHFGVRTLLHNQYFDF